MEVPLGLVKITAGTENLQKPFPISPIARGAADTAELFGASYGLAAHLVIKVTSEKMKRQSNSRAFVALESPGVPCGMKMIDQHFDVGAGIPWCRFQTDPEARG